MRLTSIKSGEHRGSQGLELTVLGGGEFNRRQIDKLKLSLAGKTARILIWSKTIHNQEIKQGVLRWFFRLESSIGKGYMARPWLFILMALRLIIRVLFCFTLFISVVIYLFSFKITTTLCYCPSFYDSGDR